MTLSETLDTDSKETGLDLILETPSPLIAKAFGISDKGKVRVVNEDQFLIAELSKTMRISQTSLTEPKLQQGDERAHLFLVADGLGGHKAGERASALVVLAIEQFTLNTFKWFFEADGLGAQKVLGQFQSAIRSADAQIVEEARSNPELSGMGTTLTMAFHLGRQLCLVHVGDSRAYLHRDGALHQLTDDHTLIAQMIKSGSLKADQVTGQPLPARHYECRWRDGTRCQGGGPRIRDQAWRFTPALLRRPD